MKYFEIYTHKTVAVDALDTPTTYHLPAELNFTVVLWY